MLITKNVMVTWQRKTKNHYINKGYIYIKIGDEFEIKVEDLPDGSHVLVDVQCDGCGEILENVKWYSYKKYAKENGEYFCVSCALKLYGRKNQRISKLKKGKSFYQWCYDNISKELADWILSRWDYELNVDENGNIINPKDVNCNSIGIGKGYWFKCLDHPEHNSEQKNISSFTSGSGSITCNQCNTISITNPELVKFLVNKEDALVYSYGSNVKVLMRCPDCGYEKKMSVNTLTTRGFGCAICSDGYYPEKFTANLLEQLSINFDTQIGKTSLNWCKKYLYDNYISDINCIIETHGMQHYKDTSGDWNRSSLQKIQTNDKDKEALAKENKIENYIVIDCRYSTMEWIKNSIMNRDPSRLDQPCLAEVLNFKEQDINWLKCHEAGCKSTTKLVCDSWDKGMFNTLKLAQKYKLARSTIINYLKQGAILGWCNYNPKVEITNPKNNIKVICLTTEEVFDSIKEASDKYNMYNGSSISQCCLPYGKSKSAGKHPITKEKLVWQYYSEYLQLQENKTPITEELSIKDDSFSIFAKY